MNTPKQPENPPAFPRPGYQFVTPMVGANDGMTLRDWLAGKALTGIVDRVLFDQTFENVFCDKLDMAERKLKASKLNEFCAFLAYDMADCMLAERERSAK